MTALMSLSGPGLARRVAVTLGALLVYRLGCELRLPGVDASAINNAVPMTTRALTRLSIFSLGVIPIFSAMMIGEIAKLTFSPLARFANEPRGAERFGRYVFFAALGLAAIQGFGVASASERISGLVPFPGWAFRAVASITLVGATAMLAWLCAIITRYGICEGFWLLFIAPSLAAAPRIIVDGFKYWQDDSIRSSTLLLALGFFVLAIILLAGGGKAKDASALDGADRNVFANVWPPILAVYLSGLIVVSWSLLFTPGGVAHANPALSLEGPVHLGLIAALIAFFTSMRRQTAAPRFVWMLALAQIFACVGGAALTRQLELPFTIDGVWIVLIVALTKSCITSVEAARYEN
jgi:preprotein translocase subunit SecY